MGWLTLGLVLIVGVCLLVTEGLRRVLEWYDNRKNPGGIV